MFSFETETVLRLIIAIPLGGLIGFEREIQNQPAGLRTHIVLCVGATLMMLVSIFVSQNIAHNQFSDPSRIAAQVVTGIGFLGAGAIMRLGVSVKGLTTAASLWTTAGIGLAVGAGFYLGAIVTTFILLIALNILKKWPKVFANAKSSKTIVLVARDNASIIGGIESIFNEIGIEMNSIQIYRNQVNSTLEIQVEVNQSGGVETVEVTKRLCQMKDITEVEIQ